MLIAKEFKGAPNLVVWLVFRRVVNLFYRKVENLIKNGYCDARAPSNEDVTVKIKLIYISPNKCPHQFL